MISKNPKKKKRREKDRITEKKESKEKYERKKRKGKKEEKSIKGEWEEEEAQQNPDENNLEREAKYGINTEGTWNYVSVQKR